MEIVKRKLLLKIRGWSNYFKGAIPERRKRDTDALIRRRIRQLLWKQWKKPGKRSLCSNPNLRWGEGFFVLNRRIRFRTFGGVGGVVEPAYPIHEQLFTLR